MQKNELILQINEWKIRRDFYARFADSPHDFIEKWLMSQSADLKVEFKLKFSIPHLLSADLFKRLHYCTFRKVVRFFF